MNLSIPMIWHVKSRNPTLQHHRINEPYATDTWFSTTTSYEGYECTKILMAQGQRPSQTIDWELNRMNQMHYLTFHIGRCPTIKSKKQFTDTV